MKSTGIVRRIDDLGRVVIPKEVRRTLKIKEGDALELFVNEGMVIFKRYAPDNIPEVAEEVRETLGKLGIRAHIYDADGDAITNAKQFHREIADNSPHWYPITNESDDTFAYIFVEIEPTEIQKAQITALVLMAGAKL